MSGVGDKGVIRSDEAGCAVDVGGVSLSGEGKGDGPTSDGVGNGDSGKVAVGGCVDVAAASMTLGVGVVDGTGVGDGSAVLVGEASVSRGRSCDAGSNRVALGTMVMRGTGEPCGVGVADGMGVTLAANVGEGRLVGVGSLREQATSATRKKTRQKYRFIKTLLQLQA